IIVTASLGVLKHEARRLFVPALPPAKLAAIDRIGFGTVDKVYVRTGLHETETDAGGDDDAGAVAGFAFGTRPAAAAATNAAENGGRRRPRHIRLLRPFTDPSSQEWRWMDGVGSLQWAGEGYRCIWITGPAARAMEALPEAELPPATTLPPPPATAVPPESVASLPPRHFAQRSVAATVAKVAAAAAAGDPPCLIRSCWHEDELYRGSYSFLAGDAGPADLAALAAPLCGPAVASASAPHTMEGCSGKESNFSSAASCGSGSAGGAPRLLFAGEATHPAFFSTAHGAFETGQREAARVIAFAKTISAAV
ncbi:unnamed protein product, partial [Phaeothamnion confervicola]